MYSMILLITNHKHFTIYYHFFVNDLCIFYQEKNKNIRNIFYVVIYNKENM